MTDRAVGAIREAFNTREILKVKVLDSAPRDAQDTGEALASRIEDAHLVQVIGRTVVLYRPDPEGPGAAVMNSLPADIEARFHGLRRLIGNTPLIAIDYTFRGERRRVFAKSENLNMTGSVKDRMALHLLRCAYERGAIHPGDLIIEATSGNTGISFAAVGRALGHPVAIFMPDWMSMERVNFDSLVRGVHPPGESEGGGIPRQHRESRAVGTGDARLVSSPTVRRTRTIARPTRP